MEIRTKPFVRLRIIVDRKLQWSLCAQGILHGVLLLVLIAAGLFAPLVFNLGNQAPNDPLKADLAAVMLYMHQRFWWIAGAGFVLIAVGALRFSHRIAGPMVRVKRNLRLMADGQLPSELRTRDGDFLKEEVACLNAAARGIEVRIEAMRAAHAELRRELQRVADVVRYEGVAADLSATFAAEARLADALAAVRATGDLDGYLIVPEAAAESRQVGGLT
jgi:hypothetical protein